MSADGIYGGVIPRFIEIIKRFGDRDVRVM